MTVVALHRDQPKRWKYVLTLYLDGTVDAGDREIAALAALEDARATLEDNSAWLAVGDLELTPADSHPATPTEGAHE